MTKFAVTETSGGKTTLVAEPTVTTLEDQEGTFFTGGEVPTDPNAKDSLPFGLRTSVKVRQLAADKLRVTIYAAQSDLDAQGESILIHEQGVRCVKTIKPGETIEIALGPDRKVAVSIQPVVANR